MLQASYTVTVEFDVILFDAWKGAGYSYLDESGAQWSEGSDTLVVNTTNVGALLWETFSNLDTVTIEANRYVEEYHYSEWLYDCYAPSDPDWVSCVVTYEEEWCDYWDYYWNPYPWCYLTGLGDFIVTRRETYTEDVYLSQSSGSPRTGASEVGDFNYNGVTDTVYHVVRTFSASGSTLNFDFSAESLSSDSKAWAIDNLKINPSR
ncbi:MAG: hypothetical protein R2865_01440 [Deinococcales bacterium]